MSVQLAPPLVVMSRNPPAAPTAIRFKSAGLTPRLYGLERKRRAGGRPGDAGAPGEATALPMRIQFNPPLLLRHTRALEKWKNTFPVESSAAGARHDGGEEAGIPTSDNPAVADTKF